MSIGVLINEQSAGQSSIKWQYSILCCQVSVSNIKSRFLEVNNSLSRNYLFVIERAFIKAILSGRNPTPEAEAEASSSDLRCSTYTPRPVVEILWGSGTKALETSGKTERRRDGLEPTWQCHNFRSLLKCTCLPALFPLLLHRFFVRPIKPSPFRIQVAGADGHMYRAENAPELFQEQMPPHSRIGLTALFGDCTPMQ